MRGYKVFNPDMTCRGFQYEVGETYKHKGKLSLCRSGFHFCLNPADCFNYYKFDSSNKVCEVECEDVSEELLKDSKRVCSSIRIVRELSWHEVLELVNTGNNNTGLNNSGNRNSGNRNSGDGNSGYGNSGNGNSGNRNSGDGNSGNGNSGNRNSGDGNSGYLNSGNGNSGDGNSGYGNSGYGNSGNGNSGNGNSGYGNSGDGNSGWFNTNNPKMRLFNKDLDITVLEFKLKYKILIYPQLVEIVNDQIVSIEYKEAWNKAWNKSSQKEKDSILLLPGFDAEIFEEITGIKV